MNIVRIIYSAAVAGFSGNICINQFALHVGVTLSDAVMLAIAHVVSLSW